MADPFFRRPLLKILAASPIVLLGVGAFDPAARAEAQAAGLISANACLLKAADTRREEESIPVRRDISEGRAGRPMRLSLQVVDVRGRPLPGAQVDLWHCDAEGIHSTADETFLKGRQITGRDGVATFRSIMPGQAPGEATRANYRVHAAPGLVLNGRIHFPDALTAYLARSVAPYNAHGSRAMPAGPVPAGQGGFAQVREEPDFYDVSMVVGIDAGADRRSATKA